MSQLKPFEQDFLDKYPNGYVMLRLCPVKLADGTMKVGFFTAEDGTGITYLLGYLRNPETEDDSHYEALPWGTETPGIKSSPNPHYDPYEIERRAAEGRRLP